MRFLKKVSEAVIETTAKVIDALTDPNERVNAPSIHAVNVGLNNNWQRAYPIGSVYIALSTIDPSEVLGGTWVEISITDNTNVKAWRRTA